MRQWDKRNTDNLHTVHHGIHPYKRPAMGKILEEMTTSEHINSKSARDYVPGSLPGLVWWGPFFSID